MRIKTILFCIISMLPMESFALEKQYGDNTVRLTGTGYAGAINNDFANDYLLRLQAFRDFGDDFNMGFSYAYDRLANQNRKFAKDAFLYSEFDNNRVEVGWTESVATKLALTLPDVGGTRLNKSALFYDDNFIGITNPTIYGSQYTWRINATTSPKKPFQFGMSRTIAKADGFDSATDFAIRFRDQDGAIKTSASFGFSYTENLNGFIGDAYLPKTFASARYQTTLGFNLQDGSFLWAVTAKSINDYHAVGLKTDGLQLGTGCSYEFLSWVGSVDYIYSDAADFKAHTAIMSVKYKINQNFNVWTSFGTAILEHYKNNEFVSAGLGITF